MFSSGGFSIFIEMLAENAGFLYPQRDRGEHQKKAIVPGVPAIPWDILKLANTMGR